MFSNLPAAGLVILIGPPGAGKSTLASLAFSEDEVVSLDSLRFGLSLRAGQDDDSQTEKIAVEIVRSRLGRGLRTVVDSTASSGDAVQQYLDAAEDARAEVSAIDLCSSTPELTRDPADHSPGLDAERVKRLSAQCVETSSILKNSGFRVLNLSDIFPDRASGTKIFLGMPVTENIGQSGFREDKRVFYSKIHKALDFGGFSVASAAVNEKYGTVNLEPSVFTRYDLHEIASSDVFLAATPSTLSPDVYLEIGLAIGAGKPVGLVMPSGGKYTQMMRGVIELGGILKRHVDVDSSIPRVALEVALELQAKS